MRGGILASSVAAGLLLALAAESAAEPFTLTVVPTLTMNASGQAPLTGIVTLQTSLPVQASLIARNTADPSDARRIDFPDVGTDLSLPLLGLRPDSTYDVEVVLTNGGTTMTGPAPLSAMTGSVPASLPTIDIVSSDPSRMEPGFLMVDRGYPFSEGYSTIFDQQGNLVWYSPLGGEVHRQLPNGEILYLESVPKQMDLLGNITKSWDVLEPLALHHELLPTPHGTYLSMTHEVFTADRVPTSETDPVPTYGMAKLEDSPVIEFDESGTILNTWRLRDLIDTSRIGYGAYSDTADDVLDWSHANAIWYDETDDSFTVSVRNQDAIIKVSRATGELIWILGPHENWSDPFLPSLLTPVGADFAWPYHAHSQMLTKHGTLLLFDNGNFRASPFDGTTPDLPHESCSRGVELAIDEATMEVSQVWEWGCDIQDPFYAPIVSDADLLEETGNVLMTLGGVGSIGGASSQSLGLGFLHPRIIEVTKDGPGDIVFEMAMYHEPSLLVVYRADKIPSLYPAGVVVTDVGAVAVPVPPALATLAPAIVVLFGLAGSRRGGSFRRGRRSRRP